MQQPPSSRHPTGGARARFAFALIVFVCSVAEAQRTPESEKTAGSGSRPAVPRIERIFVPASRPDLWPTGKWLPVEAKKLFPLLKPGETRPPQTSFRTGVYSATFDPDSRTLRGGIATLEFASRENSSSEFIPLDPMNLSLQSAAWSDAEPAVLGTDSNGRTQLFAGRRSEELRLTWHKSGRRTPFGLEFDLAFPRAIVTTLRIQIPEGWTAAAADSGILVKAGDEARPWTIQLGLRNRIRLRLRPVTSAASPPDRASIAFQQNTRIAVGPDSIQGLAEFQIVNAKTDGTLPDLLVPEEYRIDSIRDSSNRSIAFATAAPAAAGFQRIRLTSGLSENLTVDRFTLTYSPAKPDRSLQFELKTPRFAEGILLENSRMNVTVAAPLAIASYSPKGLRLLATTPPDTDGGGEFRLTFQQFQPDSSLSLDLSRPGQTGSSIEVRELVLLQLDQTPSAMIADLQLTAGAREIFDFRALVPNDWLVNSIQLVNSGRPSQPSTIGGDREITWQLREETESHSRLTVDFADSLPLKRPVTLRLQVELSAGQTSTGIMPIVVPDHSSKVDMTVAVIAPGPGRPTLNSSLFRPLTPRAGVQAADWSTLTSATDEDTRFWSSGLWSGPVEALSTRLLIPAPVAHPDPESTEDPATRPSESAPGDEPHEVPDGSAVTARPVVSVRLQSRVVPGAGQDEHALTWRFLYPVSNSVFNFLLPESATLLSAEWDGDQTPVNEAGRACSIPVPGRGGTADSTGQNLTIRYTLPSIEVFVQNSYRAVVPQAEVAIAGFRWEVSVPVAMDLVSFSDEFTLPDSGRLPDSAGHKWLSWFFGPLARSFERGTFNPLSVESWVAWTSPPATTLEEKTGWRTVTVDSGAMPESIEVHLCDTERLRTFSWFLLVISCLVGAALRAGEVTVRSRVGLFWLTGCLVAATLLPDVYAELVGAAVLGSVLSSIIPRSLIRKSPAPEEPVTRTAAPKSMKSTISIERVPTAMLVGVLGAGCGLAVCSAQSEPDQNRPIPILIPYDDQATVTPTAVGDFVYVEKSALNRIGPLEQARINAPAALITKARYQCTLESGGVSLGAELTLAVRGDQTEVLLGIPARFLTAREECRLDGQPVRAIPDPSGQRVLLRLPEPATKATTQEAVPTPEEKGTWNSHTLSFHLLPELVQAGDSTILTMPVPRVADSDVRFRFSSPPKSMRIHETSLPASQIRPELDWILDPDSSLRVAWSRTAETRREQPGMTCRSLAIVYPAWIDRRLSVRYGSGFDARYVAWRLPANAIVSESSVSATGLLDVQVKSTPEGRLVVLELAETAENPLIEIPWQQPAALPLRSLDVEQPVDPFNLSKELPLTEYLAGLSPALGFSLAGNEVNSAEATAGSATTDVVAEWQSFWSGSKRGRPADLILSRESLKSLLVNVAPLTPVRTVRPTQLIEVSRNQVQMRFSAEVRMQTAAAFMHELQLPEELAIDAVTVLEDDVDRLSHWVRRGQKLYLHLGSGTTGTQNIVLQGRLPAAADGRVSVAEVRIQDAKSEEPVIKISHSPDLTVSVAAGLRTSSGPAGSEGVSAPEGSGNVLGPQFYFTESAGAAPRSGEIVVTEAAPRDQVQSLTIIQPDSVRSGAGAIHAEVVVLAESLANPELAIGFQGWPLDPATRPLASGANLAGQSFDAETQTLNLTLSRPLPESVAVSVSLDLTRPDASPNQVSIRSELKPPIISAMVLEQWLTVSPNLKPEFREAKTNPSLQNTDLDERFALHMSSDTRGLSSSAVRWLKPLPISSAPAHPPGTSQALVLHALMPGRKSSAVGLTRILLVADGESSLALDWPDDLTPIAVYVNDQPLPASVPRGRQLIVPIQEDPIPQVVELLWQQRDSNSLKIRRAESRLPAPRMATVEPTAVLVIPSHGTSVIPVEEDVTESDSESLLRHLEVWESRLPRGFGREILTTRILETLSPTAMFQREVRESGNAVPDPEPGSLEGRILSLLAARDQNDGVEPAPSERSVTSPGIDGVLQNRNRTVSLITVPKDRAVSLWVIDDRLEGILSSVLSGILIFPLIWLLLRLETGDRMAAWPSGSWLLIGLIWWLCLRASPAGLLLAFVSLIRLAFQWLRSIREKAAIA